MTSRQKRILNIIIESYSKHETITSSAIANEIGTTSKTVQKEIGEINGEINKYGMYIDSISGKGYSFEIDDISKVNQYLCEVGTHSGIISSGYIDKNERIKQIIESIVFSKDPVFSDKLASKIFVSRSQLSNDIKEVKRTLEKYNLSLIGKSHIGLFIDGKESEKRKCLTKEKINYTHNVFPINKTGDIVADALLGMQYPISDLALQNLIFHVAISINRVSEGYKIQNNDLAQENEDISKEIEIANMIYSRISKESGIVFSDEEVMYLAINLKSKEMISENVETNIEINKFLDKAMNIIKERYGVDFSTNIRLRLYLNLHLQALLSRAKKKFLMKNTMLDIIKQNMLLAYDISMHVADIISKDFDVEVNEDEVGFLSVYFNMALNELPEQGLGANVLVIMSNRRSELLLFKYNFLQHFKNFVSKLDIVSVAEYEKYNLNEYDAIFSTSHSIEDMDKKGIIYINYFLNNVDLIIIDKELSLLRDKFQPQNFFKKDYFFIEDKIDNKEDLLNKYCNILSRDFEGLEEFCDSVKDRESFGSTYFGSRVAIPHPAKLFSADTVVCTIISDNPIIWGEESANIIFLCNVKNGNKHNLKVIYGIFSQLLNDKNTINDLIKNKDYESFIRIISEYKIKESDSI